MGSFDPWRAGDHGRTNFHMSPEHPPPPPWANATPPPQPGPADQSAAPPSSTSDRIPPAQWSTPFGPIRAGRGLPVGSRTQRARRGRGQLLVRLAFALIIVAITIALGLRHRAGEGPSLGSDPGKIGDCFTPASKPNANLHKVSCSSPKAGTRVIALAPNAFLSTPDCPPDTDAFVENRAAFPDKIACVVNLRAPHPGAPGAGGGVIRSGDCVSVSSLPPQINELPCASRTPSNPTVLGRVDNRSACPTGTVGTVVLQDVAHPVLCLDRVPPPDELGPSPTQPAPAQAP